MELTKEGTLLYKSQWEAPSPLPDPDLVRWMHHRHSPDAPSPLGPELRRLEKEHGITAVSPDVTLVPGSPFRVQSPDEDYFPIRGHYTPDVASFWPAPTRSTPEPEQTDTDGGDFVRARLPWIHLADPNEWREDHFDKNYYETSLPRRDDYDYDDEMPLVERRAIRSRYEDANIEDKYSLRTLDEKEEQNIEESVKKHPVMTQDEIDALVFV